MSEKDHEWKYANWKTEKKTGIKQQQQQGKAEFSHLLMPIH